MARSSLKGWYGVWGTGLEHFWVDHCSPWSSRYGFLTVGCFGQVPLFSLF